MSFTKFKSVIEEGDTVILYVGLSQIYAIEVKPTVKNKHGVMVEYTFQTKYGALRVMDMVGKVFGSKVQLTKGYAYVLYPTPELWTLTLPHRTQILYTPDISLIITELEIRPGSVVCEAGTGSGSLSHAILRSIGPTGHLYTCDFHQERVEVAREEFHRHGHASRVTVGARDVCESGWGRSNVANAVFLDLPKPWEALPHAVDAIHPNGGRICSFSPCVEQVNKSCEVMRNLGLTEVNTVECLQREFQFRSIVLPSVDFKKVDAPHLEKPAARGSDRGSKRQKLSSDATLETEVKLDITDDRAEKEKTVTETSEEASDGKETKTFKIRTAIPLLKMQGHTGFLTFATVHPRLKLRRTRVCASATSTTSSEPLQSTSELLSSTTSIDDSTETLSTSIVTIESTTEGIP